MSSLFESTYNPDVLSCIANLSNDEVFTPPELANKMLNLLPQEIWSDPNTTFLDPACKSGVFLREIAKRLIAGLEGEYPDLQERLDHIYKKQIFGIAITELTSLLSRRSLYCSKYPNSKYSVVRFDNVEGNVRFKSIKHTWRDGRCIYCGASEEELDRDDTHESYAYEFIHIDDVRKELPMKFDVIIGNPPYQLNDGGNGASASPIYQKFVKQAKKLNPRYLVMITPSRWFSGGKGLTSFRKDMLSDRRIRKMVDFINAKDCFPQNSVGGGVNYFLWDRDHEGDCEITTVMGQKRDTMTRPLDEFPSFVRYNQAVSIIHKVSDAGMPTFDSLVSSRNPFGLPTSTRGHEKDQKGDLVLVSSKGRSFIARQDVDANDAIDKYKVMISRITYEHAGEPDKEGKLRVLSKIEVLAPGEVCTDSYLMIGPFDNEPVAQNAVRYLRTKFARFLISQTLSSINLNKDKFCFVPQVDLSGEPPSNESLYRMFGLTDEESAIVESLIHSIRAE
ncbi:MAG: restriction endonuclease [Atopobium sp.]|nr:restriction endonuclease [Atopobium sp.]